MVTSHPSLEPPRFCDLLEPGEALLGQLTIGSRGHVVAISVGEARARRGIRLGRYERGDGVCPPSGLEDGVSRVHAFVLLDGAQLRVVDAGSTNGTFLGRGRIRGAPSRPGDLVRFSGATVEWLPAQ